MCGGRAARSVRAGALAIAIAGVVPPVMLRAQEEPIVTTRRAVTIGARSLRYTARAGRIPIRDNEAGDVHGQMFFVSYTLDRAPTDVASVEAVFPAHLAGKGIGALLRFAHGLAGRGNGEHTAAGRDQGAIFEGCAGMKHFRLIGVCRQR